MKKINVNMTQLKEFIAKEAVKLLSEDKEIQALGDPIKDIKLNQQDAVGTSGAGAMVKTDGSKKTVAPAKDKNIDTEGGTDKVKMNQQDKDQGHDEEIAAAVKVDAASSEKNGPSTKGQKNGDFESKKDNPKAATGAPFTDQKKDVDMKAMDKTNEGEGAKTAVTPGGEKTSKEVHTTGQDGAKTHNSAADLNEKEPNEPIAKGIELPQGLNESIKVPKRFENKKEMINFIQEEAKKVAKLI